MVLLLAALIFGFGAPDATAVQAQAARPPKVIHVAHHPEAADRNPGTKLRPLRSITEAARRTRLLNRRGRAVEIVVHPGTYRESITLVGGSGATPASISIAAADKGDVIVSGSAVWRNWRSGGGSLRSHRWPFHWAPSDLPPGWDRGYAADDLAANPLILRREMVFVNGEPLLQVMSRADAQAKDQTFYVDNDNRRIWINPQTRQLKSARIEVAVRPTLLVIADYDSVSLSGLTFEHAASPVETHAVSVAHGRDVLVSDSTFRWNNWFGFGLYNVQDARIERVRANNNGVGGLSGVRITDLLVQDSETSYNNWRGASGWDRDAKSLAVDDNFIDFATGQKFFQTHHATFRRHKAIGNLSSGLWFDYDNADVMLENVEIRDNLTQGVFFEASQGPLRVTSSSICGNETGVLINNARDGAITHSAIGYNELGQVFVAGTPEARRVVDHETGSEMDVESEGWVLTDNVLAASGSQTAVGTYLPPDAWTRFVGSLIADRNSYSGPDTDEIFQVAGGSRLTLEEWRDHSGQDRVSSYTTSPSDCRPPAVLSDAPLEAVAPWAAGAIVGSVVAVVAARVSWPRSRLARH